MTIGIDLRAIAQGKFSGVEEYALNLLSALFNIDFKNHYILFSSGSKISKRYADFAREMKNKNPNAQVVHRNISNRLLNAMFKLAGQPKIDELMIANSPKGLAERPDVIFAPNINLLPVSRRAKTAATFHDLSFARYGDFFSARQRVWHAFVNPHALAKKADAIIAVSKSTKQDLMEIYGIPPEKIRVVYSGIEKQSQISSAGWRTKLKAIKKKYNLPEKFILYLGTIEPRKNIIGLIKAFELFKNYYKRQTTNYKLVIAGPRGWLCEGIFSAARRSSAKNGIIFTGFIDDQDKKYLYGASDLFVYPSFYEGFGFPPLEAMSAGAPVITSDCSSLPEIAADAALMVSPYNASQLAWAIKEVLENKNLAGRMIEKGYKQAAKFFWEKCAKETLQVFEEIYGAEKQNL